jgi:valyl-tRNA synthetase
MKKRYANWTENLRLDWCISRQRFHGVRFPLWYPLDQGGNPDTSHPILADVEALPVDPSIEAPPSYVESQRDRAGGFIAESDVMDTWFTSSLTPLMCTGWLEDKKLHKRLFPMNLRPQSHEIIRTWTFYTVLKTLLHTERTPWKRIAVSGWVLDSDRKKLSKSKGNTQAAPDCYLNRYTADGVRYWAGCAALGTDTVPDETMMGAGKRLVTKLYNAARFVLALDGPSATISGEVDRSFLYLLKEIAERADKFLASCAFGRALREVERFFWNLFTDSYIELVKRRSRGSGTTTEQYSAVNALRMGLDIILRLLAPYLPFISEELWSRVTWREERARSIHLAGWPCSADFEGVPAPRHKECLVHAASCLKAVHRYKSSLRKSVGAELDSLIITAHPLSIDIVRPAEDDLRNATRAAELLFVEDRRQERGTFHVRESRG